MSQCATKYNISDVNKRKLFTLIASLPVVGLTLGVFALGLLYKPSVAHSIPAFARQTGQECSACHVGAFGPQLTPYGRDFKLNGYVWGDNPNPTKGLSAMVFGGIEHTKGDLRRGTELTTPLDRFHTNDNWTVDQMSIFYGGRLLSNVGMLAQATYNNPNESFAWDNSDVRFADNTMVNGKSLVYGVTLNNNPSVQDLWQTTPAWKFPYATSALAPTPAAAPYITSLAGTVGGAGVYGMWNDLLYAEVSGYTTLANKTQLTLGVNNAAQSDHLSGVAPYWRFALQHNFGQHYAAIGTYGLDANRYPSNDHSQGTDNFLDYAVDATYQYSTSDSKHSVSAYATALRERQSLAATYLLHNSAKATDYLTDIRGNVSYYYENTYGITLGAFAITGSADTTLYSASNAKPDSTGYTIQLDLTPLGTEKALGYPNMNLRLFIQYTGYTKFDGLGTNYDGNGRNASDNNTLYMGTWFAF